MQKILFTTLFFLLTAGVCSAVEETVQAAEIEVVEQRPPAKSEQLSSQDPAGVSQTNNDNLTDYRYCLDLKSNLEIIKCRYKK